MPHTKTQQADKLSTLQSSDSATFIQAAVVSNDELSSLCNRETQLQALREEAARLQKAGWDTAINHNTMEVEHWRPRGSFPPQQEGYFKKLSNWLKTYIG